MQHSYLLIYCFPAASQSRVGALQELQNGLGSSFLISKSLCTEAAFWKKKQACTWALSGTPWEVAPLGLEALGAVGVSCQPPTSQQPLPMRTTWGIPICPIYTAWILKGHLWGSGVHPIVPLKKTGMCTLGRPVQWALCP